MDNVPPTGPTPNPPGAVPDNDRLIAALCYPIAVLMSLIVLLTDMKTRPFLKYHAWQGLGFNIAIWVVLLVVGLIPVVQCISPLLWLVWLGIAIYYAYQAYQGQWVVIPVVTDFIKKQGWV